MAGSGETAKGGLVTRPVDLANYMTKREYFAAMALQGLLMTMRSPFDNPAERAVNAADCLIHALNAVPDGIGPEYIRRTTAEAPICPHCAKNADVTNHGIEWHCSNCRTVFELPME